MKILVICQYYYPEPFKVHDLCEALVSEGHEVDVVTSFPNYPMGEIYEGYKNGEHKDEVLNGVNVHRVFTIGRRTGFIWRVVNYYTYSISSTLYVSKLKKEYDKVFVYQLSPVMMANAAIKYKKKHNKKMFLYCLDLWPDSLTTGGLARDSFIYKFFERVSAKVYRSCDKIFVSSRAFSKHLSEKFDLEEQEIIYLPQYAEDIFEPTEFVQKENIDLTFAGNIGAAQGINTIIEAAGILKEEKITFHIVGDGSELSNCKKLAEEKNLSNVVFHGRKAVDEMPEIYKNSDAMLVTLSADPVISMTLPGKVQTYMAAGKPIIGAVSGEASEIINEARCGFCAKAEDVEGLCECVKQFIASDKAQLGKNARKYYEENFQKADFINRISEEFKN